MSEQKIETETAYRELMNINHRLNLVRHEFYLLQKKEPNFLFEKEKQEFESLLVKTIGETGTTHRRIKKFLGEH